jgi:uncharacterized cofD-like protein
LKPKVVALGGGHGLAASLQAARRYAADVTAIVSVADDGGSSGRLREAFGIPAPGDLRRCLVALADDRSPLARAFDYRFDAGELEGHALGNLLIAGLAATMGDFAAALAEAGRLLGLDEHGRVLPATTGPVDLKAQVGDGEVIGQVHVHNADEPITCVSLVPADAAPPPEAIEAIRDADQVVIGPGSLYTSVLAVLAVPALREAVAGRTGGRVYVCNLRPQTPETAGFDAAAHVAALEAHGVVPDVVVHDPDAIPLGEIGIPVVPASVARDDGLAHDPALLAAVLAVLLP